MDWVAAVSDQKEWDHDGGWEELRKVLLSAPPSCVTASTKRSWSSGVQRNRGLGSAAEEEEFMTPASAERSPLLFLPYKLGRSWSCCWCAGDDVVDCCGRCSPGCCIKLPAGFAAVYFLIWYILDFTVKKQLHRSWIAAGGFNDQSSAWLVPEYGVFSCLEDQDLKSHQQFQVNLLRRPPEEVCVLWVSGSRMKLYYFMTRRLCCCCCCCCCMLKPRSRKKESTSGVHLKFSAGHGSCGSRVALETILKDKWSG